MVLQCVCVCLCWCWCGTYGRHGPVIVNRMRQICHFYGTLPHPAQRPGLAQPERPSEVTKADIVGKLRHNLRLAACTVTRKKLKRE